jgi:hypothetical protein
LSSSPTEEGNSEAGAGSLVLEGVFSGDDYSIDLITSEPNLGAGPGMDLPQSMTRVVDGVAYSSMGFLGAMGVLGEQDEVWIRADEDPVSDELGGLSPFAHSTGPQLDRLFALAEEELVSNSERVDATAGSTHTVELKGAEVAELMGLGDTASSYFDGMADDEEMAEIKDRIETIDAWVRDNVALDLSITFGENSAPSRLELSTSFPTEDYPDCAYPAFIEHASMVIEELGVPQTVEAPPADQVKTSSEIDELVDKSLEYWINSPQRRENQASPRCQSTSTRCRFQRWRTFPRTSGRTPCWKPTPARGPPCGCSMIWRAGQRGVTSRGRASRP